MSKKFLDEAGVWTLWEAVNSRLSPAPAATSEETAEMLEEVFGPEHEKEKE